MGSVKVGAEMRLMLPPTSDPAISGRYRKWEASLMPYEMKWFTSCDLVDQLKKLTGGDTGAGNEVTPQDREGAATAFALVAIGAKKRNRLTSR